MMTDDMQLVMTWDKFETGINLLKDMINPDRPLIKDIYGIPRGGTIMAIRLSHLLEKSYQHDMNNIIPEETLIVDDVSDTGDTLLPFKEAGYKIATLYFKPHSKVKPDYYVWETKRWIVYPWERV